MREMPRRAQDSGFCWGDLGLSRRCWVALGVFRALTDHWHVWGRAGGHLSRNVRIAIVRLLGLSAKTKIAKEKCS